ncbi:MAG: hypothetical protein H6779_03050 [Candidatus Nomurabacteria bacterium]|nr:MAG: hypothetical protein H6779_03050 [Candidatus Nomurabacteria bacterium]
MQVHNKQSQTGAAMLLFIMFFVMASSALTFLLSRSITSDMLAVSSLSSAKQTYLSSESSLEDATFRLMDGETLTNSVITEVAGIATTTVSYIPASDEYKIQTNAKVGRTNKIDTVILGLGAGTAFNYGLQTGNGGFELTNSAMITGNAFSNGPINGQGSSLIKGDAVSTGPSGSITNIHATGSAWANTLNGSHIEGDAYFNVGSGNTVDGTSSPYTTIDPASLPIDDTEVTAWENKIIEDGSIIPSSMCSGGDYLIDSDTSLGNVKIECNLRIRKTGASTVVTLTGSIWVTGNISLEQGPKLKVDPSLTGRSVQLIADNPADRLSSSKISIANSTEFEGSGHPSSFIMLLSQNESSELGGAVTAINIGQSSSGDLLLYAGHGKIEIGNQIFLKSVTGHRIEVGNNSDITYDTGLMNVVFTGGPSGGFVIRDWYQE